MTRKGDWMQTFTGRQFWPLDPRAGDVDIIDIASALSKLARYGGHTRSFYSVAEHSVLLARRLHAQGFGIRVARAALMHDASEAYLSDVIRPIKPHLTNYLPIEHDLMTVIASVFDFDYPLPAAVKAADNAILHDEQVQAMSQPPAPWGLKDAPLGVRLQFWHPDEAAMHFMTAFAEFGRVQ